MARNKQPNKTPAVAMHGEDALCDIAAITIILESGQKARFNLEDELCISDDPVKVGEEVRRSPARVAFWAYQMERALAEVRRFEAMHDKAEGEMWLTFRKYYQDHTDEKYIPKELVTSATTINSEVTNARANLNKARRHHGIIRAISQAVRSRDYVLRELVASQRRFTPE